METVDSKLTLLKEENKKPDRNGSFHAARQQIPQNGIFNAATMTSPTPSFNGKRNIVRLVDRSLLENADAQAAFGERQSSSFARVRNVTAFRINMHDLNDVCEGGERRDRGRGAAGWSNGMSERSERGGERKDILRRDSRNSYSCLTTTRRSIMQRLALVRGDARAVGNAREPARLSRHLRILAEPESYPRKDRPGGRLNYSENA